MRKLKHLTGHAAVEPVKAGNAVADGNHRANFFDRDDLLVVLDLLPQDSCDLVRLDVRHPCSYSDLELRAQSR